MLNLEKSREFDIFLSGETIDLCVPSDENWVLEQWYRWFNNAETTRYLSQGVYPNTKNAQRKFFENLDDSKRIAFLIKPKNLDYYIGVASLSSIDLVSRQCDFAMVIGKKIERPDSLFFGMEAKCLLTEHAFETVGLERINSTQAIDLIAWQRWQILFGYQMEGLLRKKFRKGMNAHDVIASSCLAEDYLRVKASRKGNYWPGKKNLFELLKKVPKDGVLESLVMTISQKQKEHLDFIINLNKTIYE
jgi:RimJ/RimL family protein N-acetyltransferase